MIGRASSWTALVSYCALIYWQSSRATLPLVARLNVRDKLMHAAGYALLALLAALATRTTFPRWRPLACGLGGAGFALLFGISDEVHQRFVPGRSAEVLDVVADAAGGLLAALVFTALAAALTRRAAGARKSEPAQGT